MTTRAEALQFMEDSRQPAPVPDEAARVETFRRLGFKSDTRSIAETLRVVALLPVDPVRTP